MAESDAKLQLTSNLTLSRKPTRKFGNFVLNNIVGVHAGEKKRKKVPDGYKVAYTHAGQAYLVKEGEKDDLADAEAAEEHTRKGTKLPLCCSAAVLAETFGEGIYQYFDFIFFLCITNVFLFVLGLGSLIPHFIIDGWQVPNNATIPVTLPLGWQENFYTSSYSPRLYWWWVACTALGGLLFLFTFGPVLSRRIALRFKSIGYDDDEDRFLLEHSEKADIIKDETGQPSNPRRLTIWRLVLSYLGFVIVLLLSGIFTLGLVIAQEYIAFRSQWGFWASIGVSVVVSIMNVVWKLLCDKLTLFERHYTWSQHLNHHTVKFFVFRVLNLCLMLLARWLVSVGYFRNFPVWSWIIEIAGTDTIPNTCQLGVLGEQFLTNFLTDLTLGNIIEIAVPFGLFKFAQCRGTITAENLDSGRPDFELAEEYLELTYRQFQTYIGFALLPPIGLLSLILNLLDYPLDKARLLRLHKTPPPLRGSMHHFLVFFLFISAVTAIAVFPYGTGWVLAGFNFGESVCPYSLFAGQSYNETQVFATPDFTPVWLGGGR